MLKNDSFASNNRILYKFTKRNSKICLSVLFQRGEEFFVRLELRNN